MRMTKGNFISLIAVLLFFGYVIFIIVTSKNLEKRIIFNGYLYTAIITEIESSKFSSKMLTYEFEIKKLNYKCKDLVNYKFSEKYKAGDTIIIKFLSDEPEKSMIIEDKEYKSCYGIPPLDGWKELPQCD